MTCVSSQITKIFCLDKDSVKEEEVTCMFIDYDKTNAYISRIVKNCALLHWNSYSPPFYLFEGLLQSAFNRTVVPKYPRVREVFEIPPLKKPPQARCCPPVVPEGIVSVDWLECEDAKAVILLIPGLTSSSEENYIITVADRLRKSGYKIGCYNPRGRGGNEVISPFLFSAGYTGDLRWLVNKLHERYEPLPLIAIGFSIGATYLTNYLTEEGINTPLKAAMINGGILDCMECNRTSMGTFKGRYSNNYLAKRLQKFMPAFEDILKRNSNIDVEKAKQANYMMEYDDAVIAPMMGYTCFEDYYKASSPMKYLNNIKRTTLFVSAKNDPVIDYISDDLREFKTNTNLIRVLTEQGGHSMSWPSGLFGARSWIAEVAESFVAEILKSD